MNEVLGQISATDRRKKMSEGETPSYANFFFYLLLPDRRVY